MDWTQTLTIIGVFAAFFIYLMNRMDGKIGMVDARIGALDRKLDSKVDMLKAELKGDMRDLRTELKGEMQGLRTELKGDMRDLKMEMSQRLSNIEGHLMPRNILPFEQPPKHDEEPKEN